MTAVPAHGTTHIAAPSLCRVVALLSAVCWCWVLQRMAAEMPDLSHLTPEEREIIESVVHRQKQEEQKEQEIMRLVKLVPVVPIRVLRDTVLCARLSNVYNKK